MDIASRLECLDDAHRVRWELGNSVDHWQHAMWLLLCGDIESAHWELWRGGLTRETPWKQIPIGVTQ